jgi:hypothetical protein
MSTGRPRFSIITPCLNRARFIEQALASVRARNRTRHIVIDGGSTDWHARDAGARARDHADHRSRSRMYDALNGACASRRIAWAFSIPMTLRARRLRGPPRFSADTLAAVAGNARVFRSDAAGGKSCIAGADDADLLTLTSPSAGDNAWFFQRMALAVVGEFDAGYRIAGDREFMLRFALSAPRCASVDTLFYRYRQHPGSMTIGGGDVRLRARMADEHLAMTRRWLGRPGLPPRARELLRELRRRDTLDMAARCAHAGEVRALLRYAAAGTRRVRPGAAVSWRARRAPC